MLASDYPTELYKVIILTADRIGKIALINAVPFLGHYALNAIPESPESV